MHDELRPFSLEGVIGETNMEQEKTRIEEFLRDAMKEEGCVELLDVDPQWSLEYDFKNSVFDFKLTMYGAEVEDAWRYSGIMGGKLLERHTANSR